MEASQSHRSLFTVSLIWETGSPTTFCISSITYHDRHWLGLTQAQSNVCSIYETLLVCKSEQCTYFKAKLHILLDAAN